MSQVEEVVTATKESERVVRDGLLDRGGRLWLTQQPQLVERLEHATLLVVCAYGFESCRKLELADVRRVLRRWASVLPRELGDLLIGRDKAILGRWNRRRFRQLEQPELILLKHSEKLLDVHVRPPS
ncbi:MAG TPA: hypothetical protein VGY30_10595 [Solirubrobacteraceae bacterium]|nr:hypothetical protein [Solirubrobacteraceae bacterium]